MIYLRGLTLVGCLARRRYPYESGPELSGYTGSRYYRQFTAGVRRGCDKRFSRHYTADPQYKGITLLRGMTDMQMSCYWVFVCLASSPSFVHGITAFIDCQKLTSKFEPSFEASFEASSLSPPDPLPLSDPEEPEDPEPEAELKELSPSLSPSPSPLLSSLSLVLLLSSLSRPLAIAHAG